MSETSSENEIRAGGLCSYCQNVPCVCAPEDKDAHHALAEYRVTTETSDLLSKDQQTLETFTEPWIPGRRTFGALPHFDKRNAIVRDFANEAKYFAKHYTTGDGPEWRDPSFAEGALLFELKFGKRLSEFTEEILAHYPDLGKKGKEISLFGLSGAGKSTAVEAIKEHLGTDIIAIDSDTARMNLLGKMVKDVELEGGASLDEVRQHLIHNAISGALYYSLNHVAKELKDRGYNVIHSSTRPTSDADLTVYIEHPDGLDPRTIGDDERADVAKNLYARTQNRVSGPDDFDWEHAETVTDFRAMKNVTVQVPENVHGIFLKNIREALEQEGGKIEFLKNPKIDDSVERKAALAAQLKHMLEASK